MMGDLRTAFAVSTFKRRTLHIGMKEIMIVPVR